MIGDLDGKVALVTGAARGLGLAMADALAGAGVRTVLVDRDGVRLNATVREIEARIGPGKVLGVACDITDAAGCERLIARTVETFGALHILVNNAGIGPAHIERAPNTRSHKFWETDRDAWQDVITVNVNGTFLLSHVATPHLIRAGWGRIVNVTTSLGTMQRKANSPYGVSKTALEAATLIWAQDLADTGVTVNSLVPGGAADTEFVSKGGREDVIAAGRVLLQPSVMVAPILWLASTRSDGVTGCRFVGKLWDIGLPEAQAIERAREPSVLLQA